MSKGNPSHVEVRRVEGVASLVEGQLPVNDPSLLQRVLDAIGDPVFVKNEALQWILVNQAFCEFVGHGRADLIGRSDADLLPPEEAAVFNAIDREVFDRGVPRVNEELLTSAATGRQHIIRTTKTMFVDEQGRRVLVGIFTDLTELRTAQRELEQANERLRNLAMLDALTGLPNRRAFEAVVDRTVASSSRGNREFCLLFIDLNDFKGINDTLGHDAGDALLKAVGARLSSRVRAADFVARLGGDEFVVLASDTDTLGAEVFVERIREALSEPVVVAGRVVSITASIGLANYPRDGRSRAALLKVADDAMYAHKRTTSIPMELDPV